MNPDFTVTVRNYQETMLRRARHLCRDGVTDPEEVVQEMWFDAWKVWSQVDPQRGLTAFLFLLLDRAAIRMWRATH